MTCWSHLRSRDLRAARRRARRVAPPRAGAASLRRAAAAPCSHGSALLRGPAPVRVAPLARSPGGRRPRVSARPPAPRSRARAPARLRRPRPPGVQSCGVHPGRHPLVARYGAGATAAGGRTSEAWWRFGGIRLHQVTSGCGGSRPDGPTATIWTVVCGSSTTVVAVNSYPLSRGSRLWGERARRVPVTRVVSLVPSLTEAVAVTAPGAAGRASPTGARTRPDLRRGADRRHQEPRRRRDRRPSPRTSSSPTRRRTAPPTSPRCARPGSRSWSPRSGRWTQAFTELDRVLVRGCGLARPALAGRGRGRLGGAPAGPAAARDRRRADLAPALDGAGPGHLRR